MAKITRTNPEGIFKPFSNYSHVVTAEGAQKLVFCEIAREALIFRGFLRGLLPGCYHFSETPGP